MALRLIELVLDEEACSEAQERIKDCELIQSRLIHLPEGKTLLRILLDAEQNELVLDSLEELCANREENRILVWTVEATLPRIEENGEARSQKGFADRIAKEELYEDIKGAARCTRAYLIMIGLATVVAAVGLHSAVVPVLIGAMVIAPLMGPCIALSLATTLGDLPLLWQALRSIVVGIVVSAILALIFGFTTPLETEAMESMMLSKIGAEEAMVALASGCAGALAFTTGISAVLIGVMVAVALLPSLVAFGLLLGSSQFALALGALSLFILNLTCINLAGVVTFLFQGVRPHSWWEKGRAVKATVIAIALSLVSLGTVIALLVFN